MAEDALPLVVIPALEQDEDLEPVRDVLDGAARVEVLHERGPRRKRQLESAAALLVFAWRLGDDETGSLANARLVQSVWAGVDRLPTKRLQQAHPGLAIASGSGPNAVPVAEHAVALYLDCAKRITLRDRDMRKGGWLQSLPGRRVSGSRVAVVGVGAIGSHVVRLLAGLGVRVTAVTRDGTVPGGLPQGVEGTHVLGLQKRLGDHQGVVLCVPLSDETDRLVDRAFLRAMPDDGILVNVARGKIINEGALFEHLRARPSFTAGLDVWWRYPRDGRPRPQNHPFETLENVVMTPHSAFNVPGARREMIVHAAENVRRTLLGQPPKNVLRPGVTGGA